MACQGHLQRRYRMSNQLSKELRTRREFKPCIAGLNKLDNLLSTNLRSLVLKGSESSTHDDGGVLAIEIVGREKVTHLHVNELEHLRVGNHVDLVNEDDKLLDADLAGQQQVLPGLGHLAVGSGDDDDSTVHLSGTRNHVLDVYEILVGQPTTGGEIYSQSACPGQSMWP